MPSIHEHRFTAIDFESAGAGQGQTDCPVQVGMASWSVTAGHTAPFVSYIHTSRPILWSAQKVHGITAADLADAPTLPSLWPEFRQRLTGAVVVAHGKGTEKRFLRAFPGHGFGPWVDTLLLARAAWPDLPNHSLGSLCASLDLTTTVQTLIADRSWHDALFDAIASLVLLERLIAAHHLGEQPVAALAHPDTSAWHRQRRP